MKLWGNSITKSLMQILFLALLLSFTAGSAWAQDDDDDASSEDETEEDADLGRITVTGSLLRREEFTSTSPMQIINAETQALAGQLSAAQILQGTTVAAGTTQLNNTFNGFVVQGGTGVQTLDLRGLGAGRTLLLLDGRRPGGSGTRGEVQAFDLSNIPEIAAQRFEIVLDGSSSIYGSDAVAGVANVITRRSFDGFDVQATTEIPFDSGGERYRIGAIFGKIFEKGSFAISGQWTLDKALRVEDRGFLRCGQDIYRNAAGERIDRQDNSITSGTELGGCNNLYANTAINAFTGVRYIPSPDGVSEGPIPGYRPRNSVRYGPDNSGQASYEDQLNFDFVGSEMARNRLERINIYATSDYTFDSGVDWDFSFLYSKRKTKAENWRQFFPLVSSSDYIPYPGDPEYNPGFPASQPVMPYPSNADIDVKYIYATTGFSGLLDTENYWSWELYGSYSHSDGDYINNSIMASRSGDIRYDDNPPQVDYFSPAILSGQDMQSLVDAVGFENKGNTKYENWQFVGIISGDLFELPAGTVGTAVGLEYRNFSINDQPSAESQRGDLWGQSNALITKGTNNVWEAFVEAEIPIVSGKTGFEDLRINMSARAFTYDIGGSDYVWKTGLKWSITPSIMLRGTVGTSYRAPALFELFLGDQTAFADQLGIDPCIDYPDNTNENIRRNCAAEGIPADYNGFPSSSAEVTSGGGAENLEPETSKAYTAGLVWTPEFADLSIAFDYFDIKVENQIAQLGSSAIIGGCYNSENFPNAFCDQFTRASGDNQTQPYNILTVDDTYLNVNEQRVKGVDMNLRFDHDLSFGSLVIENQSTWYSQNVQQLFDPGLVSGFDTTDYVGRIGSPDFLSNTRIGLRRDDWTFTYYVQYVAQTDEKGFADEETTYFDYDPAYQDITMDSAFFQNFSVFYQQEKWDLLMGINNLFDKKPDRVSSGAGVSRRGNVPIAATQYDLLGRRFFARVNYRF